MEIRYPQRGEIWLVNLDPTIGAEIKKIRPALIISNDRNNQYALTVTIIPITDHGQKVYPFHVALPIPSPGLTKDSKIKCEHIRTVDKIRLVKFLGSVSSEILEQTEQALSIHLGINFT